MDLELERIRVMLAVLLPVFAFVLFLAIFYVRDQRHHTPVGSVALPEIPLRSYTGGCGGSRR
jgi:hypothetical protein